MKDFWTPEKEGLLRELWPHHSEKFLAEKLNATVSQITNRAYKLGLKKAPGYINSGCFKKGSVPANKGTKGLTSANRTTFKKGQLPHNIKADGAISIRTDKRTGNAYKYIRLAKAKWKELHRHIWETAYGPIPKRTVIYFKDGNSMNCTIENLAQRSMKENMLTNSLADNHIAQMISAVKGGRGRHDPSLKDELLKYPEIIEAKRNQLILNRLIKENGQTI